MAVSAVQFADVRLVDLDTVAFARSAGARFARLAADARRFDLSPAWSSLTGAAVAATSSWLRELSGVC